MDSETELPKWFTSDFFVDIFEKILNLSKNKFKVNIKSVKPFGGAGENYTSQLFRATIEARNNDVVLETLAVFVKAIITMPELKQFSVFIKEARAYNIIIPAMEEIWRTRANEELKFGPKCYKIYSEGADDIIVLEDISNDNAYQVADRHKGLNVEQSKTLLNKLAKYHAASATHLQLNGMIDGVQVGIFAPGVRPLIEKFFGIMLKTYFEVVEGWSFGPKYLDKLKKSFSLIVDFLDSMSELKEDRFNILAHGDMWVNNLLFAKEVDGESQDVQFIDYQNGYYGTPALDLYTLMFSSISIDYKIDKYDEFIKYYYDSLVESLKKLNYPKAIPSYEDFLLDMEEKKMMAAQVCTGMLAIVLANKNENASLDMLMQDTEEAEAFRRHIYDNPRYVAQVEKLFPFLENKGLFDV